MALEELTAQLRCLYGPEAQTQQADFAALGGIGLAVCATEPGFPPAVVGGARSPRWIAREQPPIQVQTWPRDFPPPAGWHEVSAEDARRLQADPFNAPSSLVTIQPLQSRAAALSTAGSSTEPVAARRRPRTPREARFARSSRLPRLPRDPRPARQARAPRAPRGPRPTRPPRAKRPPRPRRPPFKKTKYDVGVCKRPACTCWTPAGCASKDLWILMGSPQGSEGFGPCFPGPCYDYVACVTHVCVSDVACAVHGIFQFWAKQYKAVAVYVDPVLAPLIAATPVIQQVLLAALPAIQAANIAIAVTGPAGVTEGCPPGTRWAVGLTGFSCQSPITHPTAATREQLIAAGILKA